MLATNMEVAVREFLVSSRVVRIEIQLFDAIGYNVVKLWVHTSVFNNNDISIYMIMMQSFFFFSLKGFSRRGTFATYLLLLHKILHITLRVQKHFSSSCERRQR